MRFHLMRQEHADRALLIACRDSKEAAESLRIACEARNPEHIYWIDAFSRDERCYGACHQSPVNQDVVLGGAMFVYLFTQADVVILDKMYRGILSTAEAREFLARILTNRCDWADYHRCIDGAVRGGYAVLARDIILTGENRVLTALLDTIEREVAQSRTGT